MGHFLFKCPYKGADSMSARISDWTGMYLAMAAHPKAAVDFLHVSDVVDRLAQYRETMDRERPVGENHPGPGKIHHILFEVCRLLELKPEEMERVLGAKLYARLKAGRRG